MKGKYSLLQGARQARVRSMPHMAGCPCPAPTRHIRTCTCTCTCAACLCMYAPCLPLHRVVRVGPCLPKVLIPAAHRLVGGRRPGGSVSLVALSAWWPVSLVALSAWWLCQPGGPVGLVARQPMGMGRVAACGLRDQRGIAAGHPMEYSGVPMGWWLVSLLGSGGARGVAGTYPRPRPHAPELCC